jgi:hypothetical protein
VNRSNTGLTTLLLVATLLVLPVSCQSPTEPSRTQQEKPAPAPAPPWQANVPGAAPNFEVEQREAFNPIVAFRDRAFVRTALSWVKGLQPNQGGIIWLAALIVFFVATDHTHLASRRNLDLLLLLAPSLFLVDVTILGNTTDAAQSMMFGLLYLGLFLGTVLLLVRSLMRAFEAEERRWVSNVAPYVLVALTILLFVVNVSRAVIFRPNDSGTFTNIGAQRMLTTGQFPYGDPQLRGGAAATYGPVLYLAHIPFQLSLKPVTTHLPESDVLHSIIVGDDVQGSRPPAMATKLTVIFFHLLGVLGLVLLGRRMAMPDVGWALGCLYVSSPYVMGLGGEDRFIGGMTYISHIAPTSITVLAFLALPRPLLSGSLLAVGAGALFYPAFLFPLWVGYYFWKRVSWLRFTIGFVATAALILAAVVLLTHHTPGESVFSVLYESTVGHQEAHGGYGSSTFSFWGTQPWLGALWQRTLVPGWYLLRPSVILFALLIGASFFLARNRSVPQLAFLTAAVIIAVQIWKSHAGGTYVEWYYPFLLIGLLIPSDART